MMGPVPMNRQQFEHFLQFPGELSSRDTADLMELIRSFPYCQTLYLMLARAHSGDDSPYFQEHLRMAAARAIDRKRLKQLILDYPGNHLHQIYRRNLPLMNQQSQKNSNLTWITSINLL